MVKEARVMQMIESCRDSTLEILSPIYPKSKDPMGRTRREIQKAKRVRE
jgi:hypothetical protein